MQHSWGVAFERIGHRLYAVLDGGCVKWAAEGRPMDASLPTVMPSNYPMDELGDRFTIDYMTVLQHVQDHSAVIMGARPSEYYTGAKSDEARTGHIPGALKRPFTEDLTGTDKYKAFKSAEQLAEAYCRLIPSQDAAVIVHCRTGASGESNVLRAQTVSWISERIVVQRRMKRMGGAARVTIPSRCHALTGRSECGSRFFLSHQYNKRQHPIAHGMGMAETFVVPASDERELAMS